MTKEEAERQIQELLATNKAQEGRLARNETAISDLRAALKAQAEGSLERSLASANRPQDDDLVLRRYVTGGSGSGVYKGLRVASSTEEGTARAPIVRAWGLFDDPVVRSEWHGRLQELIEQRSWVQLAAQARGRDHLPATPRTDAELLAHLKAGPESVRRIFADISTVGAENIPDLLMPVLERALILEQERRVMGLFQTVSMPGKNMLAPYASGGLRPYKKGEPASAGDDNPALYTVSSLTEAQRTITAVAMAVRSVIDEDAAEDSVIPMIPLLQEFVVSALLDGVEDAAINGDTTASHQDTGIASWNIRGRWGATGLGGTSDHRRTVLGLRADAIDNSCTTDGGSVQTLAGMTTARKLMGLYATSPGLVCITSPEYLLAISNFAEFLTVNLAQSSAFNVNGLVGSVGGVPIVTSAFIDRQYNASGVYDNSTKTKTGLLLVDRSRWRMYMRKGAAVETQRDITRGITHFVATMRWQFKTLDTNASGATNVVWVYNLTP